MNSNWEKLPADMHATQRLTEELKSFINRENWIREQLYKIGEIGLNENMSHLLIKVMASKSEHAASRIRSSKKKSQQLLAATPLVSKMAGFEISKSSSSKNINLLSLTV